MVKVKSKGKYVCKSAFLGCLKEAVKRLENSKNPRFLEISDNFGTEINFEFEVVELENVKQNNFEKL